MFFSAYIEELQKILHRIANGQGEAIAAAGRMVAASLGSDGIVHVFGSGHSHMIAEEAFFRAGGLIQVNPILDERLSFFHGALASTRAEREEGYIGHLLARERIDKSDVAVVVSNSGRNAAPVEMAMEMAARGVPVIAITNVAQSSGAQSRHSSGKRLFELAAVVIDTYVPEGDAVLRLPGMPYAIGPASTVSAAVILNSIVIEAAAELLGTGKVAATFPSANHGNMSDETLFELFRPYKARIRYLDEPPSLPHVQADFCVQTKDQT